MKYVSFIARWRSAVAAGVVNAPFTIMAMLELLTSWAGGWVELTRHDALPAYRARTRLARLRLDFSVLAAALRAPGTWYAALLFTAAALAVQIVAWELDLIGWRRDGMLCLPVLLVAPWVAAGRRRLLEQLVERPLAHDEVAMPVTAPQPSPRQSLRVAWRELRRWRREHSLRAMAMGSARTLARPLATTLRARTPSPAPDHATHRASDRI